MIGKTKLLEKNIYLEISCAIKYVLDDWTSNDVFRWQSSLCYIYEGSAELIVNDKKYILNKGDLCLIPITSITSTRQLSKSFGKFYIHFQFGCNDLPAFYNYDFNHVVNISLNKDIYEKFMYICENISEFNMSNIFKVRSIFFELLALFFKDNNPVETNRKYNKSELKKYSALWFIVSNFDKDITINDVSDYVGVHPKYLSRVFKDSFRYTVNNFINLLKSDSVRNLAASGEYSLKEIANFLGYKDKTTLMNWVGRFKNINFDEPEKNIHKIHDEISKENFNNRFSMKINTFEEIRIDKENSVNFDKSLFYIIHVKKGTVRLKNSGYSVFLHQGDSAFIKSISEYKTEFLSAEIICIGFTLNGDLPEDIINIKLTSELDIISFSELYSIYASCGNDFYSFCNFQKKMMDIFCSFFDSNSDLDEYSVDFTEILSYINENLGNVLSVPDIASHFKIKYNDFIRYFKFSTGITPNKYISDLKYKKVIELIKEDEISLNEISKIIGFQSYEGFRLFIKRMSGEFPNSLKEKIIKKQL